jgi:alpha-L-fucosidase
MKKINSLLFLTLYFQQISFAQTSYLSPVRPGNEPIAPGKFEPTWQSLKQYQVPEWFRNAKFGIWAHWGPSCQAEQGDWFVRFMYNEGSSEYKWFVSHYSHSSKVGFKEIINDWKTLNWDRAKLVALYKRAGAQYFVALANHHDNFDMWNSKYQGWNSVRVGPKKDIIAGWAEAARKKRPSVRVECTCFTYMDMV